MLKVATNGTYTVLGSYNSIFCNQGIDTVSPTRYCFNTLKKNNLLYEVNFIHILVYGIFFDNEILYLTLYYLLFNFVTLNQ